MYKRARYSPRPTAPGVRRKRARRGLRRRPIPRALTTNNKLIKARAVNYFNHNNTGTLYQTVVQLNSCDDPFGTQGTGQPLGYDQWKALYRYAYVIGSKVTARVHNNGASAVMFGMTPMKINQSTTALSNYEYYMESPATKSRILSQDLDHVTFSHGVNVKRFLNIKDLRDNNDYRIDLVNETAPTTIAYWHVWTQPLDEASATDVDVVLTAEYMVLLVDPILPARSVET